MPVYDNIINMYYWSSVTSACVEVIELWMIMYFITIIACRVVSGYHALWNVEFCCARICGNYVFFIPLADASLANIIDVRVYSA